MTAERQLSILNVGGHPKDAVMYAGGTLAKHVERGDRVCTLTPTSGMSHHLKAIDAARRGDPVDMAAYVQEREQELIDAAGELGVTDVRFLGHDDEILLVEREIIEEIADVIGSVRPDIVITHNPYDSVWTHGNVAKMTLLAIDAAAGIRVGRPYLPHGVTQVFFHAQVGRTNVHEGAVPRVPTTLIDITSVIHKKFNAMQRFRSQHYGGPIPLQRKLGEVLDGSIAGIHARVPYHEGFIAETPEVYDFLPLSDYAHELSKRSEIEVYRDMTRMLLDPERR